MPSDNPESRDQEQILRVEQLCKDACTRIQEHVDTIQIFVTFHAEDGQSTKSFTSGRGNFYARQGQIEEWVRFQHEYQKQEAKRQDASDNQED